MNVEMGYSGVGQELLHPEYTNKRGPEAKETRWLLKSLKICEPLLSSLRPKPAMETSLNKIILRREATVGMLLQSLQTYVNHQGQKNSCLQSTGTINALALVFRSELGSYI